MLKCCLLIFLAVAACQFAVHGQQSKKYRFRVGATIAFGLSHIADNKVGIGAIAAAERSFNNSFAGELEASYTYFTGEEAVYTGSKNKAWAIPVLAGIKFYALHWFYGSLRAGVVSFLLNSETSTHIRPAYGIAAGMNLPEKNNRLNVQLGYTSFRFGGNNSGYATLAAAIIIN